MRQCRILLILTTAVLMFTGLATAGAPSDRGSDEQRVVGMALTGEIANTGYGYVIRSNKGEAPGEIFTILNPNPLVLNPLVNTERIVTLQVRVVSGDNVAIETIDGRPYDQLEH